MNPLTNVKNINKLNEIELSTGSIHKKSWHDMYKGSAWIFIGGLEYGLTEGDVITVFSQYGEVVNINLVRDKKTGKSKGYCFICFANQKSTVLAVDNLNGIKLCSRTIRVDHVADYKPPKEDERDDEVTKMLKAEGCAPRPTLMNESSVASNSNFEIKKKKAKKEKKKKKRKHDSDGNNSEKDDPGFPKVKVKKEKHDAGYDKYDTASDAQRSEKRNHQGSRFEATGDTSGHSRGIPKSNQPINQKHQSVHERRQEDEFVDRNRLKERSHGKDGARSIKREQRRSSSDESSRKYENDVRHGKEKTKSKYSDSKRKEQYSSSSSSDSNSESSSEDERNRTENRNSKSDHQRKSYNGRKEESRHSYRHAHRNETDEFASSKKHYVAKEKDYEYNTKDKYRNNDRHDSHYRDSYSKYKHDKR